MFYFLSKAIDFLVMPVSILFLALLTGCFSKKYTVKKWALIIGLLIMAVFSNGYLVNQAIRWWEPERVNLSAIRGSYEVGILLSGGLIDGSDPGSDHPSLGRHGDRLLQTFLLFKAGKIKNILITGTSEPHVMAAGRGETRRAASLLVQWGVPASRIVFEENARNTRENALFSARILRKMFPNGKYLLITSAFHMRRSIGCFQKAGVLTQPFPANFYGSTFPFSIRSGFIPDADAIAHSGLFWHEWVGYVVYKAVGYA